MVLENDNNKVNEYATMRNYFRNFSAEKSKAHLQHMYENDKGGLK